MQQSIAQIALLVRDYDEALRYYTQILGFDLLEDIPLDAAKRWVVVAPKGGRGCRLLLARAKDEDQLKSVGRQAGGRVFLFLHTDDFWRDHRHYASLGVTFTEEPRLESYGAVAVFEDLYGNRWDLIGPRGRHAMPAKEGAAPAPVQTPVPPRRAAPGEERISLAADAGRNLFRIRYVGKVSAADLEACEAEAQRLLSTLKTGFSVLADMGGMDSMSPDCASPLARMMDRYRVNGVDTVVRVLPDPSKDIGLNILGIIHYTRDIHVVTCPTLAEAEKILGLPHA